MGILGGGGQREYSGKKDLTFSSRNVKWPQQWNESKLSKGGRRARPLQVSLG